MTGAPPSATSARDDVRVARVHLRMGQLMLARAELEDLLRRDQLDVAGLAALAEARWRTGERDAASDAALDHIDAGGNDDVALCIAAEALAAEGRASEARALMDRLPASDAATLDVLFAGMPRRGVWPAGPVDRSDLDELRRGAAARPHDPRRPDPVQNPGASGAPTRAAPRQGAAAGSAAARDAQTPGAPRDGGAAGPGPALTSPDRAVPGPREVLEVTANAGWEGARGSASGDGKAAPRPAISRSAHEGRRGRAQLDPVAQVEKARVELGAMPERAFLRLSLVLRHDPTLAPAVLQLLHLRREPSAALVRGDAQRLLGRHLEAEAAFDAAAESLEVS